jgi:hypothetical protein
MDRADMSVHFLFQPECGFSVSADFVFVDLICAPKVPVQVWAYLRGKLA